MALTCTRARVLTAPDACIRVVWLGFLAVAEVEDGVMAVVSCTHLLGCSSQQGRDSSQCCSQSHIPLA